MRNRALQLVTTDLVLLLDVDFLPASAFHESYLNISGGYKVLHTSLSDEPTALVLPAFEYVGLPDTNTETKDSDATSRGSKGDKRSKKAKVSLGDAHEGPKEAPSRETSVAAARAKALPLLESKARAVDAFETGEILAFHLQHYAPGHKPTNYSRWIELLSTEKSQQRWKDFIKQVDRDPDGADADRAKKRAIELQRAFGSYSYTIDWNEGFEPFVVMDKKFVPWYDERFIGFGEWMIERNISTIAVHQLGGVSFCALNIVMRCLN